MLRPFQCLLGCLVENTGILLAASGSCIYSFGLSHGSLLSTWPPPLEQTQLLPSKSPSPAAPLVEEVLDGKNGSELLGRPSKRRKKSSSSAVPEVTSAEAILKGENDDNLGSKESQVSCSVVIKLAGPTKDQLVVAVTEDKYIRVLRLSNNGVLTQLSERSMPKRPCAIVLTPDEKSILCADKFGDVYSLPLIIFSSQENNAYTNGDHDKLFSDERKYFPKVPAANSRTVHTRRNQEALQNQQRATNTVAKKRTLDFTHKLLLGHVSLLTDLACATLVDETLPPPRQRSYILTSDRDEHIRVSRGIPQTHVIEGYCLGHTEFVAKLCIPSWNNNVLISGGGDDFLLIWDWLSGTARQKVDLRSLINEFISKSATSEGDHNVKEPSSTINNLSISEDGGQGRIAVSGMWDLRRSAEKLDGIEGDLVVAFEGIPALFIFAMDIAAKIQYRDCCPVSGNVVDVTALDEKCTIIYSLDNCHTAFSTTTIASEKDQISRPMLGYLSFNSSGHWKGIGDMGDAITCMEQSAKAQEPVIISGPENERPLRELLYGIENLRKRGQEDS
ncbi:tRNA (guanine-N(7)-)-methyltransferase non-catalytic subunit trm82 [Pseudocyphellaria aurata]|nr:tRNA (guanine-N(7)-)-methyltransferase non-catalytic subunit trm82 [Pseudocyphellaria aurata]